MRWFLAAAFSCLLFAAIASSTFVALRDSAGTEYLFAWPGGSALIKVSLATATALAGLFLAVWRSAPPSSDTRGDLARNGRWLAPLTLLGLTLIGILPAVPGIGEYAAPLSYFFYDLRWWWLALCVGWTLVRAEFVVGSPIRRRVAATVNQWSPATKLLAMDGVIFIGLLVWAVTTTPNLRFIGALHGDEPKYIRYCEVWYQGGGLDISGKSLFTDQPLDSSPHLLTTASWVPRTIVEESRAFVADLRQFASHPFTFRWSRIKGGNGFVEGKHGGIYEIYQPGLSVVLFPGYFVDRYLLGVHRGYQGEFPDELVMTNLTMLFVYGFCGVALFRLLRNLMGSDALAMLWATLGLLMLPAGAFAFQFYPELPALLIVLVVSNFLLARAEDSGPFASLLAGAGAGTLCWMHPRFLLLSMAMAVLGVFRTRTAARRAFITGYCLVLLSVMGFEYRVTGSWLPTARWDAANTGGTLNGLAVPMNLAGYLFHRTWGLLPHAFLLIGAAPGLALLARNRPALVMSLLVFALCLGIPAAGHTLSAAAGTPGRLVVAVVPLFVWPVAAVIRRFASSTAVRSTAVMLMVLSLDASLTYNWTHKKHVGPIHGIGMSGWKPNLMFPDIAVNPTDMSATSLAILLLWIVILAALSLLAWRQDVAPDGPSERTPLQAAVSRASVVTVMLAIAIVTTAAIGRWSYGDYLLEDYEAHRLAARALVSLDRCRVCFTSRDGPIDWTSLNPNRADSVKVELAPGRGSVVIRIDLVGEDERFARFGRVHLDFGDGHVTSWSGIVDQARYEHLYRQPGTYSVVTWLQLRDGRTRLDRHTINIGGAQSGG
jgi:hypothetical protein